MQYRLSKDCFIHWAAASFELTLHASNLIFCIETLKQFKSNSPQNTKHLQCLIHSRCYPKKKVMHSWSSIGLLGQNQNFGGTPEIEHGLNTAWALVDHSLIATWSPLDLCLVAWSLHLARIKLRISRFRRMSFLLVLAQRQEVSEEQKSMPSCQHGNEQNKKTKETTDRRTKHVSGFMFCF